MKAEILFPHMLRTGRRHAMGAIILGSALLLSACQADLATAGAGPAAPGMEAEAADVLTIQMDDYSFSAPQEIAGGWVKIEAMNDGQEPHHTQLVRLNDGVTNEEFLAALQTEGEGALALVTLGGGPGPVDAGGAQAVTVYLEPGNYFLLCLLPDAQGVPHLAHGMVTPLTVTAAGHGDEPQADAQAELLDFSFVLPQEILAGKQTWAIHDAGEQPHELSLIKLADGKSGADVAAWMKAPSGPPPFANVGGMQGIDPDETAYLHLNLTPGNYMALCHIPDPASGKPHEELGMVMPFTVQ